MLPKYTSQSASFAPRTNFIVRLLLVITTTESSGRPPGDGESQQRASDLSFPPGTPTDRQNPVLPDRLRVLHTSRLRGQSLFVPSSPGENAAPRRERRRIHGNNNQTREEEEKKSRRFLKTWQFHTEKKMPTSTMHHRGETPYAKQTVRSAFFTTFTMAIDRQPLLAYGRPIGSDRTCLPYPS